MSTIRVVVFEPGKPGEVRDIDNGLEAMQAIVGGYIEQGHIAGTPLFTMYNEEGRLHGLPPNRNGLVGTFFVCRAAGEDYASLKDQDVAFLLSVLKP